MKLYNISQPVISTNVSFMVPIDKYLSNIYILMKKYFTITASKYILLILDNFVNVLVNILYT